MRTFSAFVAAALCLSLAGPAAAASMGGTVTGKIDSQKVQLRGGFDHVTVEETATGVNKGPGTPLDGAKVTIKETVVLDKGQGTAQGVITFTASDGSTTTSAYVSKVTTDAKGVISAQGKFKTTGGTGALARMRGSGVESTLFTSKTAFTTTWKGAFTGVGRK